MANIEHKNLTDAELHEPKGVSAASSNTVYVADGAGSGSWSQAPYKYTLNVKLADISTAGSAYVVAPIAGTIQKIYSVIDTAITVADATLTFKINDTLITSSSITVAYLGSAPGDVDSSTPSANNVVAAGDVIEVITDGASTETSSAMITLLISV